MKENSDFMQQFTRDLEARKAARKILNVPENADKKQLQKAYKQAAVKYHPDHNKQSPEANKKFKLIKCAYELLAFDKPCDNLLEEINRWSGIPEDSKYKLDNTWGHFLWWKEKFFSDDNKNKRQDEGNSCI